MRWIPAGLLIIFMALALVRHLLSQVRELLVGFARLISAWREVRRVLADGEGALPVLAGDAEAECQRMVAREPDTV